MKKTPLLIFCFLTINLFAQHEIHEVEGKAVVYFVRPKSMGALINFTYFDGENAIGKFNGQKYMRYECEPGKHLFWARSENKDFLEAELESGKMYMIEALPRMGGVKAAVKLKPVDVKDYKMKKIQKLLWRKDPVTFTETELQEIQIEMQEVVVRAMEKYEKVKEDGKEIAKLEPTMTVAQEDVQYEPSK